MKKLIFDFDGTMVDSMPLWTVKMKSILEDNGIFEYPENLMDIVSPLGYEGVGIYYTEVLGLKKSVQYVVDEMNSFAMNAYANDIVLKETVKETLLKLRNKGYSLNVLTACKHPLLDPCLKREGIYEIFDNIWTCDDFHMSKSDVAIYRAVAEKLHAPCGECMLFDDNINALMTCKDAGFLPVGVYDAAASSVESEMEALCSGRYIYSFAEITEKVL